MSCDYRVPFFGQLPAIRFKVPGLLSFDSLFLNYFILFPESKAQISSNLAVLNLLPQISTLQKQPCSVISEASDTFKGKPCFVAKSPPRRMSSTRGPNNTAITPLLTYPGVPIEVWVEVNEKKIPCYSREQDKTTKEVTCWIESEAGKVRLRAMLLLSFSKKKKRNKKRNNQTKGLTSTSLLQPLSINCKTTMKDHPMLMLVYLDGTYTGTYVLTTTCAESSYRIDKIQVSDQEACRLTFGVLELTG